MGIRQLGNSPKNWRNLGEEGEEKEKEKAETQKG